DRLAEVQLGALTAHLPNRLIPRRLARPEHAPARDQPDDRDREDHHGGREAPHTFLQPAWTARRVTHAQAPPRAPGRCGPHLAAYAEAGEPASPRWASSTWFTTASAAAFSLRRTCRTSAPLNLRSSAFAWAWSGTRPGCFTLYCPESCRTTSSLSRRTAISSTPCASAALSPSMSAVHSATLFVVTPRNRPISWSTFPASSYSTAPDAAGPGLPREPPSAKSVALTGRGGTTEDGLIPSTAPVGQWRSLVAHQSGGLGVAGSNPVCPTIYDKGSHHPSPFRFPTTTGDYNRQSATLSPPTRLGRTGRRLRDRGLGSRASRCRASP